MQKRQHSPEQHSPPEGVAGWTVKETCAYLRCSPPTLYNYINRSRNPLKSFKIDGNRLVDPEDAKDFVKQEKEAAA